MEKYGFIYLWYDRKRKMYYIGCHWGHTEDGYICSSNRMRDAYRRRPKDFKRRILKKVMMRNMLLEEEYTWLKMIKEEELGKKYYNLRKHKWEHWSENENKRLTIGQKISKKNKGQSKPKDTKWRESLSKSLIGKSKSVEHAAKCRLNGAKKYMITDPDNKTFDVFCLKDFAKEIGVCYSYLFRVASGGRKQYKGYRVNKI